MIICDPMSLKIPPSTITDIDNLNVGDVIRLGDSDVDFVVMSTGSGVIAAAKSSQAMGRKISRSKHKKRGIGYTRKRSSKRKLGE